jgi:hypothetical protein
MCLISWTLRSGSEQSLWIPKDDDDNGFSLIIIILVLPADPYFLLHVNLCTNINKCKVLLPV